MKASMKTILAVVAICSLFSTSPVLALYPQNDVLCRREIFFTMLFGKNEVPPVNTRAFGFVFFMLSKDSMTLHFFLFVARIENVTASHIHLAAVGVNGPVVVPLYTGPLIAGKFNGILAKGTITAQNLTGPLAGQPLQALLMQIEAGNTYVNVHATQHPGGEIRGQL